MLLQVIAVAREGRAVGRPRGRDGARDRVAHPPRLAAREVEHVEVGPAVLALPGSRPAEGETAAVGRPGLAAVLAVAVGHLARRAGRKVDDEEVPAPVERVALAVGLVLRPRDAARALLPALPRLRIRGRWLEPDACRERDAARVGRPRGGARARVERRELARLAAGRGHDIELRLLILAIGEERKVLAVG